MTQHQWIKFVAPAIVGLVGGIVIYFKYFKSHFRRDIMKVLWTNNSQQCGSSVHNKKICDTYCYKLRIEELKNLINSAKYSVDVAMHYFTLNEFSDCLIEAHQRHIKVRLIYCYGHSNAPSREISNLYDSGILIASQQKNENEMLMHHKFCIIDGHHRVKKILGSIPNNLNPILMTGSCNWTKQGFLINYENIIITNKMKLMDEFENEFESMWKDFRANFLRAVNKRI